MHQIYQIFCRKKKESIFETENCIAFTMANVSFTILKCVQENLNFILNWIQSMIRCLRIRIFSRIVWNYNLGSWDSLMTSSHDKLHQNNFITLDAGHSVWKSPKCRTWHFPPIFVLLKVTGLVTQCDRKLQVFKKIANFWHF